MYPQRPQRGGLCGVLLDMTSESVAVLFELSRTPSYGCHGVSCDQQLWQIPVGSMYLRIVSMSVGTTSPL